MKILRIIFLSAILVSSAYASAGIFSSPFMQKLKGNLTGVDSNYVERNHYDWALSARFRTAQEYMKVESDDGLKTTMHSTVTHKIGPHFGWRFLKAGISYDFGYKIDDPDRKKQELSASIFSQMFNFDLVYRVSGGDYSLSNLQFPYDETIGYNPIYDEDDPKHNAPNYKLSDYILDFMNLLDISGYMVRTKTLSANGYYVFNHKKFSYPAAWTNATRQKISVGSPLVGLGYTRHSETNALSMLQVAAVTLLETMQDEGLELKQDFKKVLKGSKLCSETKFEDFTLWGGYAYNWVPCRNVLIGASATIGAGIKHLTGNNHKAVENMKVLNDGTLSDIKYEIPDPYEFSTTTIDWNAVGRISAAWTNDKLFGGVRANVNYNRYKNGSNSFNYEYYTWGAMMYFGFKFGASKFWKAKRGFSTSKH